MPWNPQYGFHSQLADADGNKTLECVRSKSFTYTAEKDPADHQPYVLVMMTEANYAKDNPSDADFIRTLSATSNGARTKLSCTFEIPAELAENEIMLGFAPDRGNGNQSDKGYGGDKYSVHG
jgi:hypothetical protein